MIIDNYDKTFETKHYLFHFKNGSLAEKNILSISQIQEKCYEEITQLLKIYPDFKINYYLIETPEEVGLIYSEINNDEDDEPCNGFTNFPNTIYCVYNENIKCIGMHEDTHIISYAKFRPQSAFLREGLAMYMDKVWKGVKNEKCVYDILKSGYDLDLYKFFDNQYFFKVDCNISYPLAGAFVNFIVENYGIDVFLNELYYNRNDYIQQLDIIFQGKKNHLMEMFLIFINKTANIN